MAGPTYSKLRDSTGPLSFGPEALNALKKVEDEAFAIGKRALAEENGLSLQALDDIIAANDWPGKQTYELASLKRYYNRLNNSTYGARFDNGIKIEINSAADLQSEIAMQSSDLRQVYFEKSYTDEITIAFSCSKRDPASYALRGRAEHVNHISQLLDNIISNMELEFKLFYTAAFRHGIGISLALVCLFILLNILFSINSHAHFYSPYIALSFPLLGLFLGPLWQATASAIYTLFPPLEFFWGRAARKRKAYRSLVLYVLAGIVLPLALAIPAKLISG